MDRYADAVRYVLDNPVLRKTARRLFYTSCSAYSHCNPNVVHSNLVRLDWQNHLAAILFADHRPDRLLNRLQDATLQKRMTEKIDLSFVVVGRFLLRPPSRGSCWMLVENCPPLNAVHKVLTGNNWDGLDLEIPLCLGRFCSAFCESPTVESIRHCDSDNHVGNKSRSWCLRGNKLFDGQRLRYLPEGWTSCDKSFFALVAVQFYQRVLVGDECRVMCRVNDLTVFRDNSPSIPPVLQCHENLPLSVSNPTDPHCEQSGRNVEIFRIPHIPYSPADFFNAFMYPKSREFYEAPLIVERLSFPGLRAFQKISRDQRHQLWNAYCLMDLWYDEDPWKEETVVFHSHPDHVCKECRPGEDEDRWIARRHSSTLAIVRRCVCRNYFCSECDLTPLVTYDFPREVVQE